MNSNSLIRSFCAASAAIIVATAIPIAAQAVTIFQGILSAEIRSDNGAINYIIFDSDNVFFGGTPVSDWGLRVGSNFDRATWDGLNTVGTFGTTSGPVGGVVTATGIHEGVNYQRA